MDSQSDPSNQNQTPPVSRADIIAFLERHQDLKPILWQGKIGPAFWTVTGLFSLTLNIILILVLILAGRELFALKQVVSDQLISGLYDNFVLMDEAVISTMIQVEDTIPVQFTLPVETSTSVILTEDTLLQNATVDLATGGLTISGAPTDIILKAGTELPVHLDILVPVDTTVPVQLEVDVDIPLKDTQLHTPFVGLQSVVSPYNRLFSDTPNSWEEVLCANEDGRLCRMVAP